MSDDLWNKVVKPTDEQIREMRTSEPKKLVMVGEITFTVAFQPGEAVFGKQWNKIVDAAEKGARFRQN